LKDTDSDGFGDKEEIATGHDPTCATGKTCVDVSVSSSSQNQEHAATDPSARAPLSSAVQADLEKLKNLTPAQVRALLNEKGFSEAELKDIDDETLIAMYRESLLEAAKREQQSQTPPVRQPSSGNPPSDAAQPNVTPQDFANLSKSQIIGILSETGELSKDQLDALDKLDEKTVRSLFLQSIENAQNTIDASKAQ
jgi:hypothetical protein